MRTGDMKQEMGTGPGPFKVITDNSQAEAWSGLLSKEKLKSHPRSGQSADPSRCLRQPPLPNLSWRRKAGVCRCWSCWGPAQR